MYRERYDMKPLEPTVRHVAPNGVETNMGYLVWPNHNPANDFYRNRLARLLVAGLLYGPGYER